VSAELLPREETEAALDEILGAPPFNQTDVARDLVQRLIDWYRATVGDLHLSDPVLFWGLVAGLSVALGLLLWHVTISLRAVWRAVRSDPVGPTARVGRGDSCDLGPAHAAYERGEYRHATELAWSIATGELLAAGEEARTPRQRARSLRPRLTPEQRLQMEELLRLHEHACYAGEATAAIQAEQAVTRAAALIGTSTHG
jgi:hypothetical protein